MNEDTMTQIDAWSAYDRWLDDGRIHFLDEPPNVETEFRALSRRFHAEPKLWADAYLAAFANAEGMRLVTFDRVLAGRLENPVLLRP
jgi:predicted nucleic acid-binding protein